ncbi:hypothetical protein [Citrobacter rodentium]|jgi:hypothetical protein|uniref:Exported virulence protein n=2 Tax=Citrobacter rodentium TaxID=67825 RepID=D2TJZ5_CITRI|nr:hypothetical protein [Citrobacter rodentium]QBY31574.1 hypothetical protein E2R62_23985 [Citrobacter rodentium]UHO31068.1 hypothetical protein K7R23_24660 [Citrobacter rodentium NBRC 105723 = DSM 16636]CBG87124.1 putative exported virulence protein [Citrobacter rodentium ICC168]HAT8013568.1 hypothetical protein [Citrobacter rodentium NBRC 105723 = DSM 16636]HAT8018137.1 hypothetical protein [Citrobacter rodentium]
MKLIGKFIGFAIMTISFYSFAGGGASSWIPNVAPSACVNIDESRISFTWNNNPECEKAISSGYASGVRIMGSASYVPDTTIAQFNKVLKRNMSLTIIDLDIYGSVNGYPAKLATMPIFRWES